MRRYLMAVLLLLAVACGPGLAPAPEPAPPPVPESVARFERLAEVAPTAREIEPDSALGARANPVQADGPSGQREYLSRLRCPDGSEVWFVRAGNVGPGPDTHYVDVYITHCEPDGPTVAVFMDMYHPGSREMRDVGPFVALPELPGRVAVGCPPRVVPDGDPADYVFTALEVERVAALSALLPDPLLADETGAAFVSFVIDAEGRPEMASFTVAADSPALARAARETVEGMRFIPAMHHPGCLVRQHIEGELEFQARGVGRQ